MSFVMYDLIFLALFLIFGTVFIYLKRENLKKEGAFFLYKTKWGLKLIENTGKKHKKLLRFLSWISIIIGYILMASIFILIIHTVYIYLTTTISQVFRAPPIMPLIPYFPQLFGLESFFPPFYFTYFLVAIIIVMFVHEFSHGIFAKSFGIRIKSSGFAFLKWFPGLFGAFVEQDEKQMVSKNSFAQKSVLSAGVFANLITAIIFFLLLVGFFSAAYSPAGVVFNSYSFSNVEIKDIYSVNGALVDNPSYDEVINILNNSEEINIEANGKNYVGVRNIGFANDTYIFQLYDDAPAINNELIGAITEIEGNEINSLESLSQELDKKSPGQEIEIVTNFEGEEYRNDITLSENPRNSSKAYLGIVFVASDDSTPFRKIISNFIYKKPNIYYESALGDFGDFMQYLLWWIFLLNVLVALMNMLPVGALDGGRFFYLTILGITGSEKVAEKSFKWITWFILFLLLLVMIKWLSTFIF